MTLPTLGVQRLPAAGSARRPGPRRGSATTLCARALVLTGLLVLPAVPAPAAPDREAIVGVWRFQSEVDTKQDGSPAPAGAMSETQGMLVYTADGFVFVNIMPKGRKWSTETATLEELRETVGNGTAYAGHYELDAAAHTVTHVTSVSMEPAFEGQRLVRTYSLQGNTLRLSGTYPYERETIRFVITWVRADAVDAGKTPGAANSPRHPSARAGSPIPK